MNESNQNSTKLASSVKKRFVLQSGRTLLISGPASIQLVQGKVGIYAYPLEKNRMIRIAEGRQFPLEALDDSTLDCWISGSGKHLEISGNTIPDSWMETMQTILENREGKIVIVGNVDTGKSTLCTIMANLAIEAGIELALLDLDLGQSDIGPPGTIGLGRIKNQILSLSEVTPDIQFFVGYISPASVTDRVLEGTRRLLAKTKKTDFLMVNTDGWTLGEQAIIFKTRLINAITPSFVVGIGIESDVRPILEMTKCTSFQINSPSFVLRRSREQRKELRELGYKKYLKCAKVITIDPQVQFLNSQGKTVQFETVDSSLVNSLLGLIDDHGWLLGIGVLAQIVSPRDFKVFSPVTDEFSRVEIGAIRLDEQGSELSYGE